MRQVSTMTPLARGPRATRRRWSALVLGLGSAGLIALLALRRSPAPTVATAPPARRAVVASPDFSRPPPVETAPGQENTVLAHDFESGLPEVVIDGILAQIDCARGSQGCLVGTISQFDRQQNTITLERLRPPLLSFEPGQVLSFDYKVGAEVLTMRVQLWARDRRTNFAVFLNELVRERWAHAQIRLADLRRYGGGAGTLVPGDGVSNIMITAGLAGESAFFVDNLRVTSHPEDAALPATTAAIPVDR
jgi:hypothetical protein